MAQKKSKPRAKRKSKAWSGQLAKSLTKYFTKNFSKDYSDTWAVLRKKTKRLSQFQLTVLATIVCLGAIVAVSISVVSLRPTIKYNTQTISTEMSELIAQFREINPLPLNQRLVRWSSFVKKNPSIFSKINELSGTIANDNVPYIPKDFDCTTYVETVAALARAAHPHMITDELIAIRYKDGNPGFLNRNHFPEADWIPNNTSAGLLRDTTTQIAHRAEKEPSFSYKTIYKGEWLEAQVKKQNRTIASTYSSHSGSLAPKGPAPAVYNQVKDVSVAYIPLEDIAEALPHIPSGSVINLVHEDTPGKPVLISHQGLLIKTKHGAYLRHARAHAGIKDQLLLPYLENQDNRTWQVVGININEFIE